MKTANASSEKGFEFVPAQKVKNFEKSISDLSDKFYFFLYNSDLEG